MKVIELTLREAVEGVVGFFATNEGEFSIWTVINCIRKDVAAGKYTLVVKPEVDFNGIITSAKGLNVEALLESLESGRYDTVEVESYDLDALSADVRATLPSVLEGGSVWDVEFVSRFETLGNDTFRVYFGKVVEPVVTEACCEDLTECCEGVDDRCERGCCLEDSL
jgi:hypothetical protein